MYVAFTSHAPLVSFNMEQLFSLFWALLTLTLLKITGQFFCRLFLNFRLCSSHCILSSGTWFRFVPLLMTFNLISWLRCYLSGFSPVGLLLSLLNNFILWKDTLKGYKNPTLSKVYSFIMLVWTHAFICNVSCYDPLLRLIFWCQIIPDLTHGSPSNWYLCPFSVSPSFREWSLTLWYKKML